MYTSHCDNSIMNEFKPWYIFFPFECISKFVFKKKKIIIKEWQFS